MRIPTPAPLPMLIDRTRLLARIVRDEGWVAALRRMSFHVGSLLRTPGPLSVYTEWMARFDHPRAASDTAPGDDVHVLVLIPLSPGQEEQAARRTLASLARQSHAQWEAWLVSQEHTAAGSSGPGIHVIKRLGASPSGAVAAHRFVTCVRPDDALHPLALARIHDAVLRQPGGGVFYGDQDGIDGRGRRHSPYFKPEPDLDLLLAQDYLSKGAFVEAGLLDAFGGPAALAFSPHALMLELAVATPGIHHVHGMLYHRRSVREDVPYPSVEPVRGDPGAVATFLARRESGASVVEEDAICRVLWPLPSPAPKVSVVIPVRDRAALLRSCVDGLLHATDYPDFELLIVDNGSVETETLELLRALDQLDQVQVITHAGPFNFSAINNQAVLRASGSLVLLLNNDIEVLEPGWMGELVSQACRAGVGAVGALLLYPDRTIQHAGVVLGLHGVAGHPYAGRPAGYAGQAGRLRSVQSLSAVTAACLMVRKSLYLEVGGLDEQLPVAFNDVDFCLRLGQRGLRTVWTPHARLCHHESASRGRDIQPRQHERLQGEIARFRDRWGALLDRDPAYHPALSLDGEAFCVSLSRRQYDAAPSRGFDPIARSNAKDATRQ